MSEDSKHPGEPGAKRFYDHLKCRCAECVEQARLANAAKYAKWRLKNPVKRALGLPADHGTALKYSRGCRCASCRAANADRARDYYTSKPKEPKERSKAPRAAKPVQPHRQTASASGIKIVKAARPNASAEGEIKFVEPPVYRCWLPLDNGMDCVRRLPCPVPGHGDE